MNELTGLRRAVASWAFMGLFGIPVLVIFDPFGGWRWQPYNAIYDQMIVSIYIALGLFAARAIRHPLEHLSFLWFIVVSSVTHGAVMLYHAVTHRVYAGHLAGDVWILAGAAGLAVPLIRLRRTSMTQRTSIVSRP